MKENPQEMNLPSQDDDEISLWDIVEFLKEGWRWLTGGVVVGAVGAVGFVLVTPSQFETTAIVQPATVGMPTTTTTRGAEVEPVAQTLERLKLPTFYDEAMLQACQAPSRQALSGSVKASQVKGNALIQVSYRAPTTALAEACVNAVVGQLTRSQTTMAEPVIKTLEEQLVLTKKQLTEAEGFQGQLEKRAASSADGASLLMLNALSKREEIVRLQKLLIEQKVQLSAPLTQPMQLLEPIYAPERPVAPKKLPVLAGGLLGGLVLGGLAFFVRRSWLGRKAA
ncbi:hypothetical protein ICHIJ1_03910 [Fluviibacter phosphoraccumulans]|uniref:Polysaccharide chain length determinant N-terminal domain-containing protein n=2 Tax=Fluviibacter phosphoraccumulans TaxID=1751046 RepID=A0A7R6TNH2_9RHOO|nr:hypothetical protein ICHIAU1_02720 [Fluviibacter phosphoraccumulans]BBU70472.1 hypothetical protein ICHIJ1_03910 [Fluviibacter phosphoraccumulans]